MGQTRRTAVVALGLAMLAGGPPPAFTQEAETGIPWTQADLQEAFSVGTRIVYSRSGTGEEGREVGGTHTFEVEDASPEIVDIYSLWEDGGERSYGTNSLAWEDAVFLFSHGNAQTKVLGTESVETPLGTFDTVVVEVSHDFFGTRQTYWMIADRPGVYAKVVDHGKEESPTHLVHTLAEVVPAGS